MMRWKIIIFTILACCPAYFASAQEQNPLLKSEGNKYVMTLPNGMKTALEKHNPRFKTWEADDYTPTIQKAVLSFTDANIAPFAVVTDANKDGVLDVVLDGRDDKNGLLLCILSRGKGFETQEIEKRKLDDPKKLENYNGGRKESGLNYYFWLAKPGNPAAEAKTLVFTIGSPQQLNEKGEVVKKGEIIEYHFMNNKFAAKNIPL